MDATVGYLSREMDLREREGGGEGGRERGREGGREGEREGGREGGREKWTKIS